MSLFSLQAQNWKRIPGSSDDLWALRDTDARGAMAALDLKVNDLMGDSFEELLQEKSAAGEPLRIVQVVPDLPDGREGASYYFGDTWREYLEKLETPLVYGYGLGSNPDLIDQLRDDYNLSQDFIDELVAMDPQEQIVALERTRVPRDMVNLLRNAFLREYTLELKDPNTSLPVRSHREFFIAHPEGHLWQTEELARFEREFLSAVKSSDMGLAQTILEKMRAANADRLFVQELESELPVEGSMINVTYPRGFNLENVDFLTQDTFGALIREIADDPLCFIRVKPLDSGDQYYLCTSWDEYVRRNGSYARDINTTKSVSSHREFFIAHPQGHLWQTEELARLERDFLSAVKSSDMGLAQTILEKLRAANADRLFVQELEARLSVERLPIEVPQASVAERVSAVMPVAREERGSEGFIEGMRNYLLSEISQEDHAVVNQVIDNLSRGVFDGNIAGRLRTGKAINLLTRFVREMGTSYYYPLVVEAIEEMRLDDALRLMPFIHGVAQRDHLWELHQQARWRRDDDPRVQVLTDEVARLDIEGIEVPQVVEPVAVVPEVQPQAQEQVAELIDVGDIIAAEQAEPQASAGIRAFIRQGRFVDARASLQRIENPMLLHYFINLIDDEEFLASFR